MYYSWQVPLASDVQHTWLDRSATLQCGQEWTSQTSWAGEDGQQTKCKKDHCSTEDTENAVGIGQGLGEQWWVCREFFQVQLPVATLLSDFLFLMPNTGLFYLICLSLSSFLSLVSMGLRCHLHMDGSRYPPLVHIPLLSIRGTHLSSGLPTAVSLTLFS